MKVLFIITKGSPFGGAQRYVYDLAVNLPDEFEVVVACGIGEELPDALRKQNIKIIKIESLQREVDVKKDWAVFKKLVKTIRAEKSNIVHLNSSKIGFLGALAVLYLNILYLFRISNLEFKISVVFTAHGWAFNEQNRPSFLRIIYYVGHYIAVLLCDTTIVVSEKARKDIAWMPFIKEKIKVIYNGIRKFKTKTKKEARLILSGEENSKKVNIFSLSELHNNKGIDIALRGLARLPDKIKEKILYCIAGDGEEKENLEKLVQDLKISKIVRFLGFIPNAKELLSGADIFILPSRTEALPYVLLEAGMIGVPIIAACVGGVPEIISDMQDGILVHPRNPREISEAILYIIENPDKAKIFKEKIKEKSAMKFPIDKMISKTYLLYKSLR